MQTNTSCLSFHFLFLLSSNTKDVSHSHKLSRGGIPLANGDALLPKPPSWAYPLGTAQDMYHSGYDRMSSSTSQAIDQAMAQLWDAKAKFVHVSLSVEQQLPCQEKRTPSLECGTSCSGLQPGSSPLEVLSCSCQGKGTFHMPKGESGSDLEWVRVVLTADPGVNMDDIVVQEPPRRKEHRRVPSTVAIEEVKVGLCFVICSYFAATLPWFTYGQTLTVHFMRLFTSGFVCVRATPMVVGMC